MRVSFSDPRKSSVLAVSQIWSWIDRSLIAILIVLEYISVGVRVL